MQYYKKLFSNFTFILGKNKSLFPILVFISLLNSFIDILGISLLVPFFNFIFFPKNDSIYIFEFLNNFTRGDLVLLMGTLIIISFFIKIFGATYLYYFLTKFSLKFQRSLKIKVLKNFLKLDYLEFTKIKTSNYYELVTNLIPIFSNEVLMPALKILSNLILIFVLSILLYSTNPKIFFILLIFLSIISIIYINFSKRNKIYGQKASLANENFLKSAKDIIFGYIDILIFNKRNFFLNRSENYSQTNLDYSMKSLIIGFVSKYIIEFTLVSFFVFYIFYLFFLDKANLNDAFTVIIVYTAVSVRLAPAFNIIINSFASINFGLFSIERIYQNILNTDTLQKKYYQTEISENFNFSEIEFQNVSFNYNDKENILKNFNCLIKKNQIIGVSGKSGSGKTTFLNLFLGLIKPTSGEILINSKLSSSINNSFYSKISYMPQNIFLFNDSIKTNITFKDDINELETSNLIKSIEKVELKDFLQKKLGGIDAVISDTGLNLSGGQKQRLALARSIYHNKEIIVLDESTSALDKFTIKKITDLLMKLKKEKTIIISSHNSEVLKICDNIIKLD